MRPSTKKPVIFARAALTRPMTAKIDPGIISSHNKAIAQTISNE